jgi:hypothetical protein
MLADLVSVWSLLSVGMYSRLIRPAGAYGSVSVPYSFRLRSACESPFRTVYSAPSSTFKTLLSANRDQDILLGSGKTYKLMAIFAPPGLNISADGQSSPAESDLPLRVGYLILVSDHRCCSPRSGLDRVGRDCHCFSMECRLWKLKSGRMGGGSICPCILINMKSMSCLTLD